MSNSTFSVFCYEFFIAGERFYVEVDSDTVAELTAGGQLSNAVVHAWAQSFAIQFAGGRINLDKFRFLGLRNE